METVFKIILLLNIIAVALCGGEPPKEPSSPPRTLSRQGRKNYGVYRPPRDYGDDGDEKDDSDDDSEPPRPPQQPPSSGNDYPNFNTYKGYNQFPSYDPVPQIPNTYKGYPFYAPYWKGGPKPSGGDSAPASPAQMMEMMMAMNAMTADDAKPEDGGIISKLVSDPKSVAAAAIIPLSIVLAATVPVFMNYMMTSPTPLVSTTATGSKEARNLDPHHGLDNVLENIARFARALDSDDCIQKTICRVAQGESNAPGSDYIKKAANAVANLVKEEWVDNLGVKHLVEGLKHGNCADVCSGDTSRPRE